MAMHFLFDSPPMTVIGITLIKVAVNFGVIITLYLVLRHGYLGRARSALAADAAVGTISQDEAHSLLSRRRRRRARRHVPRGPERARLAARQRSQLARLEQYAAAGGTFPAAVTIPAQSPPASPPQAQPMPQGTMGELTQYLRQRPRSGGRSALPSRTRSSRTRKSVSGWPKRAVPDNEEVGVKPGLTLCRLLTPLCQELGAIGRGVRREISPPNLGTALKRTPRNRRPSEFCR